MNFDEYQDDAKETAEMDTSTDEGKTELVLGLTTEVGSVARIFKKFVRDKISLSSQLEQLKDELGDVLWYVSMISHAAGFKLSEIANRNIVRIHDRYEKDLDVKVGEYAKSFDGAFPPEQQFPRKMLFQLRGTKLDELPHVEFSLEEAEPNHFPKGRQPPGSKGQGFNLGEPIGAVVNDNSLREDGYRFHDAAHIAFMTVLGWSPVLRGLLRLKRKEKEEVDRAEDGARARDLEEALSAILKELSVSRNDFKQRSDIDGEVRDTIRRVVANLEVREVPIWLWVEAIFQGYTVMHSLMENDGGWVLADLDSRKIKYFKERPVWP